MFNVVNFNVEIHNVVSMLIWRCATLRCPTLINDDQPKSNVEPTLKCLLGNATLIKIETLAQVFSSKFCKISKSIFFTEHLLVTVSMLFKNLLFCVGYWHVLEYNLGGPTQSTLAKWTAKLGVWVKIYIFSWDNIVFLWGICLLSEKMMLSFSILNK